MNNGIGIDLFFVKYFNDSFDTLVVKGQFGNSCQFGNNSSSALVSIHAPERICEPKSDPFSIKQIFKSLFFCFDNCFNLIAALNPLGPK